MSVKPIVESNFFCYYYFKLNPSQFPQEAARASQLPYVSLHVFIFTPFFSLQYFCTKIDTFEVTRKRNVMKLVSYTRTVDF